MLSTSPYQASSIHSRRRVTYGDSTPDGSVAESLPLPPPAPLPTPQTPSKWDNRAAKDRRLMSDLWCMSAATFRRFGKIEQTRGAIQEAEVRDGNNPVVWVQVGDLFVENHSFPLTKSLSTSSGFTTVHWVTNKRLCKPSTKRSSSHQSTSPR